MTKALIKNSLAERYAKIPKEIQKKIPYYLFVKHPQKGRTSSINDRVRYLRS